MAEDQEYWLRKELEAAPGKYGVKPDQIRIVTFKGDAGLNGRMYKKGDKAFLPLSAIPGLGSAVGTVEDPKLK